MSKRGNQAYRARVEERFRGFEDLIEQDVHIDPKGGTTNTVFATLTFDRQLCDLVTAFQGVGHCLENFKRKLRRSFGESNDFRVWQAHRDGYPHVHIILTFKSMRCNTFAARSKKTGRVILRVEDRVKDLFEAAWPWGFVDVEVPSSVEATRTHILRYQQKGLMVEEPTSSGVTPWDSYNRAMELNVSTLTLFRKRSFGISREWSTRLKELQTARLDSVSCITRRFLPLENVRLIGFSSMVEARRAAKDPPTMEEARVHPFELETLPLDLIERPPILPVSEFQGALIAQGARITDPNKLDEYIEGPVYDELTAKQRRRMDQWIKERREERARERREET